MADFFDLGSTSNVDDDAALLATLPTWSSVAFTIGTGRKASPPVRDVQVLRFEQKAAPP